jgi:phage gp29-like protein
MFPAAIDAASREVVIAITGQASSTEVQQGQQTGATLHGNVRQDLIDGDARTLSTCLRSQSLADYAALNFGSDELAPWPCWKTEPPEDIGARGDGYKKLGDGIVSLDRVAPKGMRVDREAVLEAAGVPLEDIPPDELAAMEAAATPDPDAGTEPDPNDPAEPTEPAESPADA